MSKRLIMGWFILMGVSMTTEAQDSLQQVLELNEIVVTASKVPLQRKESSKNVIVISREKIRKSNGKSLAQVLNEQSGIIINGTYSNPGKNRDIFIRGASGEYSLILLNGVPLKDPSGLGGIFDIRMVPLENIERIEILKGSQSTLYGSDALAGIINIITLEPNEVKTSVYGTASYGSFNTLQGVAGVSGSIGDMGFNINYGYHSSGGLSEAVSMDKTAEFNRDGMKRQNIMASLNYKPNKSFSVQPHFSFSDFQGTFDNGPYSDGDNSFTSQLFNSGVKAQYDRGNISITGLYNNNQTDRTYNSSWGENRYIGNNQVVDIFGTYQVRFIQFLAGVFYEKSGITDENSVVPNPGFSTTSPYLNILLKQFNNLNAEIGYRINAHSTFGTQGTYSLSGRYSFTENTSVFSSFSTGYKSPTLNQLYGQFGPNPDLLPQLSNSFEFGLSHNLDILKLTGTLFTRKVTDVIIYDFAKGYSNEDMQNDRGFEFESMVSINDKINFSLFYNFTDGRATSFTGQGTDTTFYNLIRRPKNRLGGILNYKFFKSGEVSLEAQLNGKRTDRYFDPETFSLKEVELTPYLLLNMNINYGIIEGKLNAYCVVGNLTNADYFESAGYNTMPLSIQMGLSFKL